MKRLNFVIFIFLMSINIFAKTNVEKEVKKIREEFVKINSEKKYKVKTVNMGGNEMTRAYYRKNSELKKVVDQEPIPSNYIMEYYLNNDKVFFVYQSMIEEYESTVEYKKIEIRYYFDDDGTLIRCIENSKIYDKGNIPEKYREMAEGLPKTAFELEERVN